MTRLTTTSSFMTRTTPKLALTLCSTLLLATGCGTFNDDPAHVGSRVDFGMESSHDSIMQGEIVTLTTSSSNTLGRSADIVWHANEGNLRTSENGRVAQVRYNEPGTYVVSADLLVDGQRRGTESRTINVTPLNIPGAEVSSTNSVTRRAQEGTTGMGSLQSGDQQANQNQAQVPQQNQTRQQEQQTRRVQQQEVNAETNR